jgi:hypothetical protein
MKEENYHIGVIDIFRLIYQNFEKLETLQKSPIQLVSSILFEYIYYSILISFYYKTRRPDRLNIHFNKYF